MLRGKRSKRSGLSPTTAKKSAQGSPPAAPVGGSLRRRALSATRGESERVALWLERGVATELRQRAARERMSLSAAVEAALKQWLAQP